LRVKLRSRLAWSHSSIWQPLNFFDAEADDKSRIVLISRDIPRNIFKGRVTVLRKWLKPARAEGMTAQTPSMPF
jgi:hypothetical protein